MPKPLERALHHTRPINQDLLLPFERVYTVPGLSVDGGEGDAVALFVARVREARGLTRLLGVLGAERRASLLDAEEG